MTLGLLLTEARRRLAGAPFGPSTREAHLLLGHVLGLNEAQILARPEIRIEDSEELRFLELLERRLTGEPVAYLVGEKEFYGRSFMVDSRVLVPRPETEHLVEAALSLPFPEQPRILDVGTGSGCLAVTLACELPTASLVATDLSFGALDVARANAHRHGATRTAFVAADLMTALRLATFDLVLSNPPYIDPADAEGVRPEVRDHEPHLALFAADAGRAMLAALLAAAQALRPGAHLLLEIGYDQGAWLRAQVKQRPDLVLVELVRDYAGIPRTAVIRRQS